MHQQPTGWRVSLAVIPEAGFATDQTDRVGGPPVRGRHRSADRTRFCARRCYNFASADTKSVPGDPIPVMLS